MNSIISIDFQKNTKAVSPESRISPEALLPLLRKIKNTSPENYAFIVKTLCIYGNENVVNLKGYSLKGGEM